MFKVISIPGVVSDPGVGNNRTISKNDVGPAEWILGAWLAPVMGGAPGTYVSHIRNGYGAVDRDGNEFATAQAISSAQSNPITPYREARTDCCCLLLNLDGTVLARFSFVGFVDDGIEIQLDEGSWTGNIGITVTLVVGHSDEAFARAVEINTTSTTTQTVSGLQQEASFVLASSAMRSFDSGEALTARDIFGFAVPQQSSFQRSISTAFFNRTGLTAARAAIEFADDRLAGNVNANNGTRSIGFGIGTSTSSSLQFVPFSTGARGFALIVGAPDRVDVSGFENPSPLVASRQLDTVGFRPQFGCYLGSRHMSGDENTVYYGNTATELDDTYAKSVSFLTLDSLLALGIAQSVRDNQITTTASEANTAHVVRCISSEDSSVLAADDPEVDDDGWSVDWTNVLTDQRLYAGLVVEQDSGIGAAQGASRVEATLSLAGELRAQSRGGSRLAATLDGVLAQANEANLRGSSRASAEASATAEGVGSVRSSARTVAALSAEGELLSTLRGVSRATSELSALAQGTGSARGLVRLAATLTAAGEADIQSRATSRAAGTLSASAELRASLQASGRALAQVSAQASGVGSVRAQGRLTGILSAGAELALTLRASGRAQAALSGLAELDVASRGSGRLGATLSALASATGAARGQGQANALTMALADGAVTFIASGRSQAELTAQAEARGALRGGARVSASLTGVASGQVTMRSAARLKVTPTEFGALTAALRGSSRVTGALAAVASLQLSSRGQTRAHAVLSALASVQGASRAASRLAGLVEAEDVLAVVFRGVSRLSATMKATGDLQATARAASRASAPLFSSFQVTGQAIRSASRVHAYLGGVCAAPFGPTSEDPGFREAAFELISTFGQDGVIAEVANPAGRVHDLATGTVTGALSTVSIRTSPLLPVSEERRPEDLVRLDMAEVYIDALRAEALSFVPDLVRSISFGGVPWVVSQVETFQSGNQVALYRLLLNGGTLPATSTVVTPEDQEFLDDAQDLVDELGADWFFRVWLSADHLFAQGRQVNAPYFDECVKATPLVPGVKRMRDGDLVRTGSAKVFLPQKQLETLANGFVPFRGQRVENRGTGETYTVEKVTAFSPASKVVLYELELVQ